MEKPIYFEIQNSIGEVIDRMVSRNCNKEDLKIIKQILESWFDSDVKIQDFDFNDLKKIGYSNKIDITYTDIECEEIEDNIYIERFSIY